MGREESWRGSVRRAELYQKTMLVWRFLLTYNLPNAILKIRWYKNTNDWEMVEIRPPFAPLKPEDNDAAEFENRILCTFPVFVIDIFITSGAFLL